MRTASGMLAAKPGEAVVLAHLLVSARGENEIAGGAGSPRGQARRSRLRSRPPGSSCRGRRGPRPARPGARPDQGSTDHSAGSARTVSVWERRRRLGPSPLPGIRATRLARSGTRRESSHSTPCILQVGAQELRRLRLVPGRVDRVETQKLPQELGRFVAERGRPWHARAYFAGERSLLGRGGRSRLGGRAARRARAPAIAWRSSSASATSSGRAPRSPAQSRRTGSHRRSSTARRAAGRRRSRGSSPQRPGRPSRSSRRSRRRSRTSARVIARARERLGPTGQRTILFLDEIHRFNKAQQDALLPAVETGLVTLIGATTENPYFEVNSALLSRTQIYELEPLIGRGAGRGRRRGAAELGSRDPRGARRADRAPGRRRRAERRSTFSSSPGRRPGPRAWSWRRATSRTRPAGGRSSTTRPATPTTTSPLRSSRRSAARDPDAALYYLAGMLEGGEDPRFIARRLIVHASEDIGMADSQALCSSRPPPRTRSSTSGSPRRSSTSPTRRSTSRAAPKSNAVVEAIGAAARDVREHGAIRPPKSLRDAHYRGREEARARRGLHLSPRRPARLRSRLPPGGAPGRRYYDPADEESDGRDGRAATDHGRGLTPP